MFRELGLSEEVLKAIEKKGYETPTPVQRLVIPEVLNSDQDIIAQAQTGTGKTAAFGLPLIELLEPKKHVQALIITPTRELALQIAEEINSLKGRKHLRVTTLYGGQSMGKQLEGLKKGVDIVVGTPGRILDHLERETLDLSNLRFLVLDEADRMLDMGFIDDVNKIIEQTPEGRRTLLFSATMPDEIVKLARKFMKDYKHIKTVTEQLTTELTKQIYFEVHEDDKIDLLCRIIDMEPDFYGIIFCRTKTDTDFVAKKLSDRGYNVEALHGDFSQYLRERVLDKFKKQKIKILVSTDVAARGIDVDSLTHVINYSVPLDPEYYVHRIGRTGRAGKEGVAITFVTPKEHSYLFRIKSFSKAKIIKKDIPEVKEVVESKIDSFVNEILDNTEGSMNDEVVNKIVERILENTDEKSALESMVKMLLKEKIDLSRYGNIKKLERKDEFTSLFVAIGKSDGITKQKLVEFISEKTGVKKERIHNVRVLENFSFVDVDFEDAEEILRKLTWKGKRRIVQRAKKKEQK